MAVTLAKGASREKVSLTKEGYLRTGHKIGDVYFSHYWGESYEVIGTRDLMTLLKWSGGWTSSSLTPLSFSGDHPVRNKCWRPNCPIGR